MAISEPETVNDKFLILQTVDIDLKQSMIKYLLVTVNQILNKISMSYYSRSEE